MAMYRRPKGPRSPQIMAFWAAQGTETAIKVAARYLCFGDSRTLVAMTPGTLQPRPRMQGTMAAP